MVTVFLVPAVYLVIHGRRETRHETAGSTGGIKHAATRSSSAAIALAGFCAVARAISAQSADAPPLRRRAARVPDPVRALPAPASGRRATPAHAAQAEQWRSRIIRASAWANCWRWRSIRSCARPGPPNCPPQWRITAEAQDGSRISAGSLTASRLFTHAGAGGNFTQLITDFGRTHNLVALAEARGEGAERQRTCDHGGNCSGADQAFYDALNAQAVLKVARQTVDTRQTTENQVSEMTQNKLKSTLDLSFADVDLSQGQLLQLDAQNNADSAMAALDAFSVSTTTSTMRSSKIPRPPPPPPARADPLIQRVQQRPDLQSLTYDSQSAQKLLAPKRSSCCHRQRSGTAGSSRSVPAILHHQLVGRIGGNMNIPLFNGFLYSEAKEASIARRRLRNSRACAGPHRPRRARLAGGQHRMAALLSLRNW